MQVKKEPKYCLYCGQPLLLLNNRLRCSDLSCEYTYYDNPTPVVAAVVKYQDKILLTQNQGWPKTWFGVVTGFLEKNEAPDEAILRELKEETNLEGKIIEHMGLYTFTPMNQLYIGYYVEAHGDLALGDELADYRLVEIAKLRSWEMGTGLLIKEWIKRYRDKPEN